MAIKSIETNNNTVWWIVALIVVTFSAMLETKSQRDLRTSMEIQFQELKVTSAAENAIESGKMNYYPHATCTFQLTPEMKYSEFQVYTQACWDNKKNESKN